MLSWKCRNPQQTQIEHGMTQIEPETTIGPQSGRRTRFWLKQTRFRPKGTARGDPLGRSSVRIRFITRNNPIAKPNQAATSSQRVMGSQNPAVSRLPEGARYRSSASGDFAFFLISFSASATKRASSASRSGAAIPGTPG
jgi:hypothetical protein